MSLNVLSFSSPRYEESQHTNFAVARAPVKPDFALVEDSGIKANFDGIVGQSPVLRRVLQLVEMVAASDATVLLLGETGTGKELIARAIHERSQRQKENFVTLNCAAIPSALFES